MIRATRKPVPPTRVSMMVHVLSVVFSSIPTRDLTSQKPESLKWEQTVAPPATAAAVQARYNGDRLADSPASAATIPAAMVIATVAEPTLIRTRTAMTNASTTIGRFAWRHTALSDHISEAGILKHIAEHAAAGGNKKDQTGRLQGLCHDLLKLFHRVAML